MAYRSTIWRIGMAIVVLTGMLLGGGAAMATETADGDATAWMDRILARYRAHILPESLSPQAAAPLQALMDRQAEDGSWPGIAYDDQTPGAWRAVGHVTNMLDLARAYAVPGQPHYQSDAVADALRRALRYWVSEGFWANNWWWNEIGVPMHMRDILLVAGEVFDDAQRWDAIEVIGNHRVRGHGANLMWSASLALMHACLTQNREQLEEAVALIWDEVEVGAVAGIQRDWSFHQHGPRLQMYHYGRSFMSSLAEMAWLMRDSPWAMPEDKQELMTKLLLEGAQWMSRGAYNAPGTVDRMVSRKEGLRAANIASTLTLWEEVVPEHAGALAAYRSGLREGRPSVSGFRHYPMSDFTVYHQPGFSVFLKTVSSRTLLTENINNENLLGVPYLNCGDRFIMRDGSELHGLQPLWQWDRLPGLVLAEGLQEQERRDFVGGLGDGTQGFAVMDHRRNHPDREAFLQVRQLTAFHGDYVVHMLGGMEAQGLEGPIFVSLEQARLAGPVLAQVGDDAPQTLPEGESTLESVAWLHHHDMGYLLDPSSTVAISNQEETGSWRRINHGFDEGDTTTAPILRAMLQLDAPAALSYAVLPNVDTETLTALAEDAPWEILRNDRAVQALRFGDGSLFAAFYEAGDLDIAGRELSVDAPCLLLWNGERLYLCDPTHSGHAVTVQWQDESQRFELPDDGSGAAG